MTFRVVPANTPTALSDQAMSSTQIYLMWRDNATNVTGHVVERSTSLVGSAVRYGPMSTRGDRHSKGPQNIADYRNLMRVPRFAAGARMLEPARL